MAVAVAGPLVWQEGRVNPRQSACVLEVPAAAVAAAGRQVGVRTPSCGGTGSGAPDVPWQGAGRGLKEIAAAALFD